MRIVKLSDLSEEEKKKVLEEQENRLNSNRKESEQVRINANNKFNDYINKNGTYNTTKHTSTMNNIVKAYKQTSKTSANNFKKANKITLWDSVMNIAQGLKNTTDRYSNNNMQNLYDNINNLRNNSEQAMYNRAKENNMNANFINNVQNNAKAYNEAIKKYQNDQIKNTVEYQNQEQLNTNMSENDLIEKTKEQLEKQEKTFDKNFSNMSKEERNKEIYKMQRILNDKDGLFETEQSKDLKKKTINNLRTKSEIIEAEKEAEKINNILNKGNFLERATTATGELAGSMGKSAIDMTMSPIITAGSLAEGILPTNNFKGTRFDDIVDYKKMKDYGESVKTANIENDVLKAGKGVSSIIGGMIPSIIANITMPGSNIGMITQALGVGGEDYIENLNENKTNKLQSALSGTLKGLGSYATEKITGGNILGKGSLDDWATRTIANGTSKIENETLKKITQKIASKIYEVGGENFEELLENQIDYIVDVTVNNKGVSFKDWLNEQSETVKQTTLTQVFLNLMGIGGNTYNEVQEYKNNAEAKQWLNEAQKIIDKENLSIDNLKISDKNINKVRSVLSNLPLESNTLNWQQNTTTTQNNPSTQQTIQETNKMAQNGNIEQILPTQNYYYEKSDNTKIDNLRKDANKYWDNSEKTKNYVNMLEKIIQDKDIDIRLDTNLKTPDGKIANGSYSNGVITINPNSTRAGEFIAIHELTHAIGTKEMINMINTYRNSNTEFDTAVKGLLQNYEGTEISEEALSDVSAQLFGNQEFINSIARNNPNIFQKIYSEIKYLWHQFRGYKNQDQFVEDLYYKWTQAYNSSNKLNETSNYYIETIEDFDEIKYNNAKELKLPKREYAILSGIVNSDSNIKPGINYVEATNATYEVYFKEIGEFKVVGKIVDGGYNDTITNGNIQGTGNTGNAESRMQVHSSTIQQSRTGTRNDEISNFNQKRTGISDTSIGNGSSNSSNIKYSIQESENNSGSFNLQKNRFDVSGNENLANAQTLFYRTRDDGQYYVQATDGSGKITYDGVFYGEKQLARSLGEEIANKIVNTSESTNNEIYLQSDNIKSETDYMMAHRPTETGAYASNITKGTGEWDSLMPEDVYEHPEWYFDMNQEYSKESFKVLKQIKNNPNAEITIYRATTGNKINKGDWVTLSKKYAEYHNNSQFEGKGNIIELKVKAKDVQYAGDDINEFGYFPQTDIQTTDNPDIRYSQNNGTWQSYLDKNYKPTGTRTNLEDIKLPTKTDVKSKANLSINENPTQYEVIQKDNQELEKSGSINLAKNRGSQNKTAQDEYDMPYRDDVKIKNPKQSSFYKNAMSSELLNQEAKQKISENENARFYEGITNKETFANASEILNSLGDNALSEFNSIENKNATAEDVALGLQLMKKYQDKGDYVTEAQIAGKLREIGTESGQTVQAFSILQRMSPEGVLIYTQRQIENAKKEILKNKSQSWIDKNQEVLDNLNLTQEEAKKIVENMKEVNSTENQRQKEILLGEVQKIITDKIPATLGDSFKAYRRISMLFNPKTIVRNITGNIGVAPINMIGDSTIGTLADKLISKKTGMRTTGTTNLKTYGKGFKEGAVQAFDDFRRGINTRDINGDKFEIGSKGKSFNDNQRLGKALNKIDALTNFSLDVGDRPFFKAEFMNELENLMKLNDVSEPTVDMIETATKVAEQRTWQDSNKYSETVLNIRKGLNGINIGGVGFGDIVIPFAKTPANLTKAIVDYSPLGVVNAIVDANKLNKATSKGQNTAIMQKKLVDDISKAFMGSMLYIIGTGLAKAGITSGEADDDKDIANFEKNVLGIQPYSIKIGDKSFTYDWAQPLAAPLGITANLTKKNKSESAAQSIFNAISQGGNMLYEQSFLQNLKKLLDGDDIVKGSIEAIADIPASLVPTFIKQIAEVVDPTARTTYEYNNIPKTALNKVVAKLPFASKTLQPATDTMGRNIMKNGAEEGKMPNIFNIFLNPATTAKRKENPSAEEIYRLYKETGDKTVFPRVAPYYETLNKEKVVLTPEQKTKIQQKSGTKANSLIAETIKSNAYKRLSDEEKVKIINDLVDYSFGKATNEVIKKDLSPENKSIQKYIDNGLTPSNAVIFKNTINNIEGKKGADGKNIEGSSSGQKALAIMKLNVSDNQKNKMLSLITTSKNPETVNTLSRLEKSEEAYTDYFALNKSDTFFQTKISRDDMQDIQDLGINQDEFMKFAQNIGNIKSEKDKNGKTISGSKKKAVANYINSLNLSSGEKAILFAKAGYPDKSYKQAIYNYINGLNLSATRKKEIWDSLGYK